MDAPKFLLRIEAVDYVKAKGLPCTKGTLQKLACIGGGPEFRKFGSRVVYEQPALDRWIEARLSAPKASSSTEPERSPAPRRRAKTKPKAKKN
jgi:hypothetical protein